MKAMSDDAAVPAPVGTAADGAGDGGVQPREGCRAAGAGRAGAGAPIGVWATRSPLSVTRNTSARAGQGAETATQTKAMARIGKRDRGGSGFFKT